MMILGLNSKRVRHLNTVLQAFWSCNAMMYICVQWPAKWTHCYTQYHSPVILETLVFTPSVTPSFLVRGRARLLYQSDYLHYVLVGDNSPLMLETPACPKYTQSVFPFSLLSRHARLLYLLVLAHCFVDYFLVVANCDCEMSSWVPVCLICQ